MFYGLINNVIRFVYWLRYKKTHIIAGVGAIVNFVNILSASGMFSFSIPHLAQINVVLGFLGLSALRAAVSKPKLL